MARVLGTTKNQAGGRILGTIKRPPLPSTTLNPYNDVPVLGQLSNFGIALGGGIGQQLFKIPETAMRVTTKLGKLVGADTTYSEKYAEGIKKAREAVYEKPFKKSLETTSGQVGTITSNILPYFAGAGVVNPITKGFPLVSRVAARTLPDIALSAIQSTGDVKATGATGAISALSNLVFPGAGKTVATVKDILKATGKSTGVGYISDVATGLAGLRGEERTGIKAGIPGIGTVAGFGLGTVGAGREYFSGPAKAERFNILQKRIKQETNELLSKTRGIQNKAQLGTKKGTDYAEIISEPVVFKGLKVENSKINPDEAIDIVRNRTDSLLEAKGKMLPEIDRFMPETPKEIIRQKAIANLEGTPADVADDIAKINKQIDVLPEKLTVSQIDKFRAQNRKSAKDVRGITKINEYTALEKASRDTVFDITDNLPFDTNKEFQAINNTIKNLINAEEFLDKTLRGQIVKGGRITKLTGKVIGAIAGSHFGILGTLAGSEVGGAITSIITNNQLGSSIKMRMIKNLTDDPAILKEAENILRKTQQYKPPLLPAGDKGGFRKVVESGEPIPLTSKLTSEAERIGDARALSDYNQRILNENSRDISIPRLPAGKKGTIGGQTIPLGSRSQTTIDEQEMARIQAQLRGNPSISRQNTANAMIKIKPKIAIPNTLPQKKNIFKPAVDKYKSIPNKSKGIIKGFPKAKK